MLKTLKDAASEVGVPYKTVYNRYIAGEIEVEKIGRTLAIEPEYLRKRLEELNIPSRSTRGVKKGPQKKEKKSMD